MEWVLLGAAALIVGVAKTSFGGLGSVSVAMLALAMPTKESTAAALLLLITGDIVAVIRYRKAADWRLLRALLPAVVPGLFLGAWFLSAVDDLVLKRVIGWFLLVFVLVQLVWQLTAARREVSGDAHPHRALSIGAGVLAGFTTMTANAAGPIMALYLQLARVEKLRFLGTGAWYFLIINVSKVPLSASLGLFTPRVLTTAAVLVPVVLVGTAVGIAIIGKVPQRAFDVITLLTSVLAAGALLIF
ncbi:MAG: sulfite exporter TauE/SafE family protein [Arachnia sp.]